jgi:single-strand DNA-binding protein
MGRIQTRNYENQDGKKVYVTEVAADTVKFLGGKPSEDRDLQAAVKM